MRHRDPPKDHGYAWMILLGATVQMTLVIGILKSNGLLFVAFQERFHSSSSTTSLIPTVLLIFHSLTTLGVMTIGIKLTSCRNLLFIGCILNCIAFVVTSQAQDIHVLFYSHGVLQGIAVSFTHPTSLNIIGQYFDKKHGFANSIAFSGGALGGLIFAPLITWLLSIYGFQGCFLIIAGMLLNGCISGALFRPTSFYTRRQVHISDHNSTGTLEEGKSLTGSKISMKELSERFDLKRLLNKKLAHNSLVPKAVKVNGHSQTSIVNDETQIQELANARLLHQEQWINSTTYELERNGTASGSNGTINSKEILNDISDFQADENGTENQRLNNITESGSGNHIDKTAAGPTTAMYASSEYISGSCMDITAVLSVIMEKELPKDKQEHNKLTYTHRIFNLLNIFDLNLFKLPMFLAFIVSASLSAMGIEMAQLYTAPYARDIGISVDGVAYLITIFSAIDMCSRILIGLIADKGWMRRSTMAGIATMIVSVSAHLLRFYTSYNSLVGFHIILGLTTGVFFSLYPVIIVDYLTLDKFPSCLGFTALISGMSVSGAFYLAGHLRDISGSYIAPFHVAGSFAFAGSLLMLLFPVIERYQKSRNHSL